MIRQTPSIESGVGEAGELSEHPAKMSAMLISAIRFISRCYRGIGLSYMSHFAAREIFSFNAVIRRPPPSPLVMITTP